MVASLHSLSPRFNAFLLYLDRGYFPGYLDQNQNHNLQKTNVPDEDVLLLVNFVDAENVAQRARGEGSVEFVVSMKAT